MKTKKVAIIGASGYSGEVLVQLLLNHPHAELVAVTSRQNAGQTLAQVFPKFASHPKSQSLRFSEPKAELLAKQADVVFLALPHGVAAEYAVPLINAGCIVIDLSADFRLKSPEIYKEFYAHDHPAPDLLKKSVYGLPEIYRDEIKKSLLIASPGCYPTSILLPVIPLLKAGLVKPNGIIADSLSGVSGAGRKAEIDYLFCECNESVRPYGVPKHRHLSEIEEQLSLAAKTKVTIQFTPHLIPVNRGILTTLYLAPAEHFGSRKEPVSPSRKELSEAEQLAMKIFLCYKEAYGNEPFVRLLDGKTLPDTKNVVGTNVIEIAWRLDTRTGRLVVMSVEDDLVKGASGQAVQEYEHHLRLAGNGGIAQRMQVKPPIEHLNEPALRFARQDFATLNQNFTVEQALASIRQRGVGEKIVYFYVVDDAEKLVGVVPTRRLLMAVLESPLSELMIRRVVSIPHTATVMEACEVFVLHKFFAFPLVDENRRVVGLVDVGLFTEEVFDIAEREQLTEVFETLGFHVAQVRDASPLRAFRVRVPWLLATIVSGTFCAFLSNFYELTLAKSLVLTFFLTMILGLAESVSMQSMAVTIQLLRTNKPSLGWYLRTLRRESTTSLLLGAACGLTVALIVCIWRGAGLPAVVIGSTVLFSAFVANLAGLSVPTLLHARKLDPKIAAGPITLAVADILTLLFYFSLARFLL